MKSEPIILFASFGHGHEQAALSLQKEIISSSSFEPELIDILSWMPSLLQVGLRSSYMMMIRHKPQLWRQIFKQYTKDKVKDYKHVKWISLALGKALSSNQVPFVISTHPLATWIASHIKQQYDLRFPIFSVITDYRFHPSYITNEVDVLFTIDETAKEQLQLSEATHQTVYQTGIPISKKSIHADVDFLKNKLQVKKEQATVMIASGGTGLIDFPKILAALELLAEPITVLCMVGHNSHMEKKIKQMTSKHQIIVQPFTSLFIAYMKVSDVLITKPGGLTISEAMANETPLIIYEPVAGHEEENAHILERWGVALFSKSTTELLHDIQLVLTNRVMREHLITRANHYKKPDASKEITKYIFKYLVEHPLPFYDAPLGVQSRGQG
ncbi:MGDG synthase family glycosyltransferase [Alkalihalobacillus pseudalcaliphilus]|uniref:MGDG synthase family glycosyltransferase n=1 Tax=Alkalihalobacillus pseudalcaliphilus TaxID=79884 RepID=UPI00064D97CF|nr:glycosyltransferase [Alkalihalobacillus pseudalcaliphilus]KMK74793.1 hypothetical protein AB990_20140 [Alkalihalobacillus pseudalcaliphilus]